MARYIPIGEPANRSEADSIRALRDLLPEHFVVIGNFELHLPHRANTFEYDAVVIGEHGLYAVEVKGWSGEVRGDLRRWTLDWGRVQNPLILTERKAKALRGFVSRAIPELPSDIFCQAVVLLPANAILLIDPQVDRVVTLDRVYEFFVDELRILKFGPGALLNSELRTRIERALLPLAAPASRTPRVGDYEIIGELDDGVSYEDEPAPYREFIGRHRLLRSRNRVRIKHFVLDPLATPAVQEQEYERALRDMEALTRLDSNPYIASAYEVLRDQEDELNFYLVSEWVGSESLADVIAERHGLSVDIHRLAVHLLRAVKFMHERGIIHRNLHPGVIYMTGDDAGVPLKITDFDYARVMQLPSIEGSFDKIGTEGYSAPELWRRNDYDHRVDIFSVGAILFQMYTGETLYQSLTDLVDHEATLERRRNLVEDEDIRGVLDDLLNGDPDHRATNLTHAIQVVEARVQAL